MYTGRTKKYAEAIIREGDNFDYKEWLRQVKEEEAQEKRVAAACNSNEPTSPELTAVVPAAEIPKSIEKFSATTTSEYQENSAIPYIRNTFGRR